MIKIVLRAIAMIFTTFVFAFIGFVVGSILFTSFIPEFVILGREGYEAGGSIGFILGALIGLMGSFALLFGRRSEK